MITTGPNTYGHPAPETLAAAATVLSAAVVAGWWLPRGPLTTVDAVVTPVAAVVVGLLAGWLTGSRWKLLGAPLTFALAFEMARRSSDGIAAPAERQPCWQSAPAGS